MAMDRNSKIDMFISQNMENFGPLHINEVRSALETMDDNRFTMATSQEYKEPMTMLLLSIFTGEWGVDRFLLGDTGMGVLKLLTGGVCGVLWIIDMIKMKSMTQEYNYKKFMQIAGM